MDGGFFENWTTQARKGVLDLCVLCAIRDERHYGYDIVKALRDIDGLMIAEGTIYPILSRFKREGLVAASLMESPEGPARKCYRLTAHGQQLLIRMLAYWSTMKAGVEVLSKRSHSK